MESSDCLKSRYISLFSGIGGLEHPSIPPILYCERDRDCRAVLADRWQGRKIPIHDDVTTLRPPAAGFVVGGWPCQDISKVGRQAGLFGKKSRLFFEMLRVAVDAGAHTVIGENVPALLTLKSGREFMAVKNAFKDHGYNYFAWRILNAREFGLPQQRRRIFVVASKHPSYALALHCRIPVRDIPKPTPRVYGLVVVWGNYAPLINPGYSVTLVCKNEAGVFDCNRVRRLSPSERLALQGFSDIDLSRISPFKAVSMSGNAVAKPVGEFVVSSVMDAKPASGLRAGFSRYSESGYCDGNIDWVIDHAPVGLASNLGDFLQPGDHSALPARSSAGTIMRFMNQNCKKMPKEVLDALYRQAGIKENEYYSDSRNLLQQNLSKFESFRNELSN